MLHCDRVLVASVLLISTILTNCNPTPTSSSDGARILLFTGAGTSANDVVAIETVLNDNHLAYSSVNDLQFNEMPESQLAGYRLLIVPGGNFVEMGNGLTASAAQNVRKAVNGGLHYLGICAGGFLAGHLPAPYKSFDLSSGRKFGFYAAEKTGIRTAVVRITTAHGPALDQYWQDGPQFSGWGSVVARYPDRTPAIVEGRVGNGWAILTGVHAEAPTSWRGGMVFNTPASVDAAYARTLIVAALDGTTLAHY